MISKHYKHLILLCVFIPFAHATKKLTVLIHDHPFYLEMPVTIKEYNQGLMYRHHLDLNKGMFFVFDGKSNYKPVMWMKNTYISLDMLFIGPDLRIVCVIEYTQPLSLNLLSCDEPVRAVIELSAGEASKFHITKNMPIKILSPAQ